MRSCKGQAGQYSLLRYPVSETDLLCREESAGPAVPKSAAERFKNAAAVLKARDVDDRRDYKERKRKQAAELKAKKRAREGEDAGGMAVTLGPGLGFPSAESEIFFRSSP